MAKNLHELIYEITKRIPYGRVTTYGTIARLAGNPRWSRVVGWALRQGPGPDRVPCHRVINARCETCAGYAFGGEDVQRKLLEAEGIVFDDEGRVDLGRVHITVHRPYFGRFSAIFVQRLLVYPRVHGVDIEVVHFRQTTAKAEPD